MRKLLIAPAAYCIFGTLLAVYKPIRADWWGLLVLGSLICLYAFLAKGERTAERHAVGDNCYIVGFVYTLSIITLSLIFDAESMLGTDGQPSELHPLLKTIGIALGTSVVGMFCRFALTQGVEIGEDAFDRAVGRTAISAAKLDGVVQRLDTTIGAVDESLAKTVVAIDAYSRELEKESERVGESLSAAAIRLLEHYQAHVTTTLDDLSASTRAFSRRMNDDWKDAVEPVRRALEAASTSINDYTTRMDAETKSVGETLNRSVAHVVEDLGHRVAQVLQANRFDDVRDALAATVDLHRKGVEVTQTLLTEALHDLRTQIDKSIDNAQETRVLVESLQNVDGGDALSEMYQAMGRFTVSLEKVSGTLDRLTDQQSKATDAVDDLLARLTNAGASYDTLMATLREDLDEISNLKERYREQFDEAATVALHETHRLYSRLIGGAALALSGLDNLDVFARDLRTVAGRIERPEEGWPPSPAADR
ncbi:MAG: hypothetical protein OXK79_04720 [Chloroflexota bacterium]|nr:hypothetical protein [Chloroflexota bacterium]